MKKADLFTFPVNELLFPAPCSQFSQLPFDGHILFSPTPRDDFIQLHIFGKTVELISGWQPILAINLGDIRLANICVLWRRLGSPSLFGPRDEAQERDDK